MKYLAGAVALLALLPAGSAFAQSCNDDVKAAMHCAAGYSLTCVTAGYTHWVCGKNIDGVVVPFGVDVLQEQHDTIETSKPAAPKTISPAPKPAAAPAVTKPEPEKKPETVGNATSAAAHEMKAADWRSGLPPFLQHMLGYEAATSSKGKMSTTTPFLSNAYFKNLFKGMLGK